MKKLFLLNINLIVSILNCADKLVVPASKASRYLAGLNAILSIGEYKVAAEQKSASEIIGPKFIKKNSVSQNSYLAQALKDHLPIPEIQGIISQYLKNTNSFKCTSTIKIHAYPIYSIIQLQDGRLASCSMDKTIKVWDSNFTCVATLEGHIFEIYSIQPLRDGRLISCSMDNIIKIWDLKIAGYDKCVGTFRNTGTSYKAITQLEDGRLASCSNGNTIKILDLKNVENSNKNTVITYDTPPTYSLIQLQNGKLAYTSGKEIRICDLNNMNSNKDIIALKGHYHHFDSVRSIIQLKDGRIASCSHQETPIRIWDLNVNDFKKMDFRVARL